jgi:hypothetical protein
MRCLGLVSLLALLLMQPAASDELKDNTWSKLTPVPGGPPSPGMGYETSLGYDPRASRLLRWGGHNQGGGGEQNAEMWALDPVTGKWELKEPNRSPPGVCCAQQNVFDLDQNRFLRFPAFSGSHGWHWYRENYVNNSTLWNYDLATNTWRDRRPVPAPVVSPLRCASWDSDYQVAVVFGGEGNSEGTLVYDPYTNTWQRRKPATQPAFRSGGNMVYDAANKVHILFGSQFSDDPHTWAYDLHLNQWRDLKPATQPATNRNDAVLAYDSVNRVVVALVRVGDAFDGTEVAKGHVETWIFDAAKNTWTQQKPAREPDGWGNRRRVLAYLPDRNVSLVECFVTPTEKVPGVDREQQVWLYRYGPGVKPKELPAPAEVSVLALADGATIRWQLVEGAPGYEVLRGDGPTPWEAEYRVIASVGAKTASHKDAEAPKEKPAFYRVRALGGILSPVVRAQPRVVDDVAVSVLSPKVVRLTWKAAGPDVVGYLVERAVVEVFTEDEVKRLKTDTPPLAEPSVGTVRRIGPFETITPKPVVGLTFTDKEIDLGKPREIAGEPVFQHRFRADQLDLAGKGYRFGVHAYRLRAVDARGVVGGPSAYFLTIPSAPEWLFTQEKGETCRLKWAANPEAGIKGYRVYRMDGPKVNGPGQKVQRLTEEPIADTRFEDLKASMDTKRYWVVAVDALGQEGIPSAPAWSYRQYRKAYEPFVGEWHQ